MMPRASWIRAAFFSAFSLVSMRAVAAAFMSVIDGMSFSIFFASSMIFVSTSPFASAAAMAFSSAPEASRRKSSPIPKSWSAEWGAKRPSWSYFAFWTFFGTTCATASGNQGSEGFESRAPVTPTLPWGTGSTLPNWLYIFTRLSEAAGDDGSQNASPVPLSVNARRTGRPFIGLAGTIERTQASALQQKIRSSRI